jgi:beta-fructofuranosidase
MVERAWAMYYFRMNARPPEFSPYSSRRNFLQGLCASAGCASIGFGTHLLRLSGRADLASHIREGLATDPLRPQYHLLPAANWMNDPNGPIYWKGNYHMFFQYNPNAAVWGDMHWAHGASPDMIHWKHLPMALAPTPGGYDQDGCFSGSAADDNGTPVIIYTGVKSTTPDLATLRDGTHNFREVQCLATSDDPQLRTWKKLPEPVLLPPQDPQLAGFRDPFFWKEGSSWYLGVGSGIRKQGGRVLLYRSNDLRRWEPVSTLASGLWNGKETTDAVDSAEMWECPDFFQLGSKHVLIFSTERKVYWETGDLDSKQMIFHSQKRGLLDTGAYYAPKTQLDARGRRILWGWIPETRPEAEFSKARWAGCMSLPRVLSLGAENELEMHVAPQANSLRAKPFSLSAPPAPRAERMTMLRGLRIEKLCAEFSLRFRNERFSLTLLDGAKVFLQLTYDPAQAGKELQANDSAAELPAGKRPEIEIHLFLDGSVLEIFANNRVCLTVRVYQAARNALRVDVSDADIDKITALLVWQMIPISPDRLTT